MINVPHLSIAGLGEGAQPEGGRMKRGVGGSISSSCSPPAMGSPVIFVLSIPLYNLLVFLFFAPLYSRVIRTRSKRSVCLSPRDSTRGFYLLLGDAADERAELEISPQVCAAHWFRLRFHPFFSLQLSALRRGPECH